MKKFFLTMVLVAFSIIGINAQDNNSSTEYLPQKGDIAFGINLNPILNYVGNIFNGSTDNSLDYVGGEPITNGFTDYNESKIIPDVSIMGKYMLTDTWVLRGNIGFMFGNDKNNRYVQDDKAIMHNPLDESKLTDSQTLSRNGMSLMLGAEYRKGKKRVQGVFGAGVLFGFTNSKTSYTYANEMTSINQHPSSGWDTTNANGYRTLSKKSENNVFFGVTGSMGIEWFVAPKVSIGAEANLNLYYISGGQEYTESEGYNVSTQKIEKRTDLTSPGNNKFRFGTENLGGSLYMSIYF